MGRIHWENYIEVENYLTSVWLLWLYCKFMKALSNSYSVKHDLALIPIWEESIKKWLHRNFIDFNRIFYHTFFPLNFIKLTIPLYTHTLNFVDQIFSFEDARPEKGIKIWPFSKISKLKIFIFQYFLKISSEINCTHPFYPIWYPILHLWTKIFT